MLKVIAEKASTFLAFCCALFALPTALLSGFITVSSDYGEWVFKYSFTDSFIVSALTFLLLLLLGHGPIIRLLKRLGRFRLIVLVVAYSFIASLVWVLIADVQPDWDSYALVEAAEGLNRASEVVWWQNGGYIERFPYQVPLILVIWICHLVAGNQTVLAFEVLNCIAIAATAYLILRLTETIVHTPRALCIAAVIVVITLPLFFYATFIYGNGISLALCLYAFLLQMKGFERSSLRNHVLAAIVACVGVLIKSSMLLVIVAMAVVWVVSALKRHTPILVVVAIATFALNSVLSACVLGAVSHAVPTNLNNGLPQTTWIVMGLGANDPMDIALAERPGMNNNYVWEIPDEDYSVEAYSRMNSQYITERFGDFVLHPIYAIKFFAKKYITEWCDPTYGSLVASNWTRGLDGHIPMAEREYTALAPYFYYGTGNRIITIVCDVSQLATIGGAAAFAVLARKRAPIEIWAPFLYAAGGAVFYLFWEAKSQYIMPLVITLIPYAAAGIALAIRQFRATLRRNAAGPHTKGSDLA